MPLIDRIRPSLERSGWNPIDQEILTQLYAEHRAVVQFAEQADALGLRVPELDQLFEKRTINAFASTLGGRACRPSLAHAIAQHHGIPTCLLDFTYNGLIAAYFAAESACRLMTGGTASDTLAVWAVNYIALERGGKCGRVLCPKTESEYIHAQDGVFLFDVDASKYFREFKRWRAIDEIELDSPTPNDPIRLITLPIEQAKEVLRLLWAEGVYKAKLMPTYDNVAEAVFRRLELDSEFD